MSERAVKVLIAKAGLDGHDRGAKVVVRALREAGFDVAYSGLHRTPEEIADAAVEQGAQALGLSIMSGAHLELVPAVMEALARRGAAVTVFAGGILPEADLPALRAAGVAEVFLPGAPTSAAVEWLRAHVRTPARPERSREAAESKGELACPRADVTAPAPAGLAAT